MLDGEEVMSEIEQILLLLFDESDTKVLNDEYMERLL
jgi:hypothetical protein